MYSGWVQDCVVGPNWGEDRRSHPMHFDWEEEGYGRYAMRFDENTTCWSPKEGVNRKYIYTVLQDCNDELNRKGYIYLDDVYNRLGFEPDESTDGIGWMVFDKDEEKLIDFGISRLLTREDIDFMNNIGTRVVLDFNVDGYIYDIIG